MLFKNMEVRFSVETDFDNQNIKSGMIFIVKRYKSGCSHYGDLSGHSLELYDSKLNERLVNRSFDTRYDYIPVKYEDWINFWKDYIEEDYGVEIENYFYQEELVE